MQEIFGIANANKNFDLLKNLILKNTQNKNNKNW